ncbi:hypothetical protein KUCAC02_007065 [Chaenocephalus aceratus]|nr:hypothetical protein KUCAC02_007065 [Chaenocephalus aceratus]
MTDYLSSKERTPCLQELRPKERQPPPCVVPSEETCPSCPGPSPPDLNSQESVTTQATVYGISLTKGTQDACEALGVSSEGSISDLMNRLLALLDFKDIYPKLFVKLRKAGGGVLHVSCVHGIVYYLNILFWTESARDHTDGLLSFTRFPTRYISDVAGRVARRTERLLFQPNDGRLCARTPGNIALAANRQLHVDMQRAKNLRSPFPPQESPDSGRFTAGHPTTGTCERLSLCDRFHQEIKNAQKRS